MADINKSRGLDEGETVITDEGITADGIGFRVTNEPTEYKPVRASNYVAKEPEGISFKIDVNVSETLTGLKSVQREAKAATVALRELERASKRTPVGINDLRDVQGQDGNWNHNEYMCGLFNGLELASATLEGRTPDYREIE